MYDDKWPRLTVTGTPVTREQAERILILTDQLDLGCNDKTWQNAAHRILTGHDNPWSGREVDERLALLRAQTQARHRHGFLHLSYLGNNRIASAAKGSTGAWCDWDGTIGARPYNIGKWPGQNEITDDWQEIARAFPFLNLRAQLVSFGHDHAYKSDGTHRAWGTWAVADGAAVFDENATEPLECPDPAPWAMGQQHLGLDELAAIVARVRAATPERPASERRHRTRRAAPVATAKESN